MKVLVAVLCLFCAFLTADFIWSQGVTPVRTGVSGFEERAGDGVRAGMESRGLESRGVPFDHSLHGDSIGLDCAACHTGSKSGARAYMPAKSDCMDCHRLPLTEKPGIEKLDSALADAPEHPWKAVSQLPDHVVFHHGVHSAAGVTCADCHGGRGAVARAVDDREAIARDAKKVPNYERNVYGGLKIDMKTCLQCHKGETFKERNFKPAATYCAACHR